jgi:hypothetical protein
MRGNIKTLIIVSFIILIVLLISGVAYLSFSLGRLSGRCAGYLETIDSIKKRIEAGYEFTSTRLIGVKVPDGFLVTKDELNKPVSPHNVYFYIDDHFGGGEDYFQVIIRLGKPIEFEEMEYLGFSLGSIVRVPDDQLIPSHYKWHILNKEGESIKSWLAYFVKNRDGTYYTVISLPKEDLSMSMLEIYFESLYGGQQRNDITFLIKVPDFLEKRL